MCRYIHIYTGIYNLHFLFPNFTEDNDYHIKKHHIIFHHRITRYPLYIGTVDDCFLERNETFSVTAVPQTPQISCNATARITIIDNDGKSLVLF